MKYFVYTIKDELNGYTNLALDRNDETAIRGFTNAVINNPDYAKFKGDFSLWCLGEFDTDKGITLTEERKIISGSSVNEA